MGQKVRCRLKIHGRVQGVGYRFFASKTAPAYDIKGYVRNMSDGTVEVVAEGKENNINEFIKKLKQGPSFSYVEYIDKQKEEIDRPFSGFDISH